MSDINVSFYDYSHVKISAQQSIFRELREYFSFFVDGYQFSPKYVYGMWDGKLKLMDTDGLLPFGLINQVVKFAQNNMLSISIQSDVSHKNNMLRSEFDHWISSMKYYSGSTEIFPYWYQLDAVYEALVNKRRILNLPTSAGKSLIQALLTKYVLQRSDKSVLILVPTTSLVTQMKDDFVDYRLFEASEIAEVRSGHKQKHERVVIATWQSAIKKPKEWFNQFDMLLCDEMHLAIGKSISAIINKLCYCEYKIGLSGSLRDGKANLMQYIGLFGEIYSPVKTKDLMDDGQVSQLRINALFLKYPETVSNAMAKHDYATEIKFITALPKRTQWISNLSLRLAKREENVFVMFKNIEHGKAIYDSIKSSGHEHVYYVSGEVSSDERTYLKKMAEEHTGVIIIASYGVFSTGISVRNLHHVILAHGVKSKVIVLQTIGRVLRKHSSKKVAQIWDLIDDMSITVERDGAKQRKNVNYLLRHGIDRVERYAIEQFDYIMKDVYFLENNRS
ncbi:helicase [Acinetobacter phage AB-Navy71]|uniref:DNA helicase n=1 Tax=Acinetobacter phage AbTZA1 TaxID=2500827 RepID=A0A3Q9R6X8_9CAUD|nr:DNA helicase [Acinetobacter phage AbTZA1]AZU98545.1 DNA helicase [Acinetobacter phage AbTZA1]UQS94262.1 helicase [Acinetobacter phage AB-Navy71]